MTRLCTHDEFEDIAGCQCGIKYKPGKALSASFAFKIVEDDDYVLHGEVHRNPVASNVLFIVYDWSKINNTKVTAIAFGYATRDFQHI